MLCITRSWNVGFDQQTYRSYQTFLPGAIERELPTPHDLGSLPVFVYRTCDCCRSHIELIENDHHPFSRVLAEDILELPEVLDIPDNVWSTRMIFLWVTGDNFLTLDTEDMATFKRFGINEYLMLAAKAKMTLCFAFSCVKLEDSTA